MAKKVGVLQSYVGGIADSNKIGQPYSFAFARSIDFRSNPSQFTINPQSELKTGTLVTDLPMWMDLACTNLYAYGNTGNIYKKDSTDAWTLDHNAPNSQGNGLVYFSEDNYLYYAQNKTIGRRSSACETGSYYDGFLESEGGEPTNAQSITFASASSQYASIADNATLSITDDITLEAYRKFTTLPAINTTQTLMSKWNQNGNQRSYLFDILATSNSFGDGSDGSLTISADTTETVIDANCTGNQGEYTVTISNVTGTFLAGQKVRVYQMRGTNKGLNQLLTIYTVVGSVITFTEPLQFTLYHSATESDANKAQIRVLKQYDSVTINSGKTWTVKPWDGLKGGVLAYLAKTGTTVNGTINLEGAVISAGSPYFDITQFSGFRGGAPGIGSEPAAGQGESDTALGGAVSVSGSGIGSAMISGGTRSTANNGAGGGGGTGTGSAFAGGGGGHADPGGTGNVQGGSTTGSATLSTVELGAGGGGGGGVSGGNSGTPGGGGGGIFDPISASFVIASTGSIILRGGDVYRSGTGGGDDEFPGAGGAGGSCRILCQTGDINTNKIDARGGVSFTRRGTVVGASGSPGRIAVYYLTSITGSTTSPTAVFIQDPTLTSTPSYFLRLLLSSNGTNSETYSVNITSLVDTTHWNRWQVTWDAPTSTANFYVGGTFLGTQVGTFTAIFNSTARFAIAASYDGSGNPQNYGDFKADDDRVWNSVRTATELAIYADRVLTGVDSNLMAYYRYEGNVNDSQTYTTASNLTATNTPTYSTDVPFSGITTRADQDILIDASGSTYTLGTALSEAATDRQTFTPTKEPIKSVELNINTVGTGNWTVVIHDGLNRLITSLTVPNAQLHTGVYEFIFADSFRPILEADYHVHVYSTVGDGIIVTSSLNDMEGSATPNTGAYFATFFQILVEDQYHPMMQFLNFVVVGNERYVGKLEAGSLYDPHHLVLPAGYRVRCFAKWNEFLAIGVWKGESITDTDQGKIFLWDGSTDTSGQATPNTIVDVLEGGVNAMTGAGGILSIVAGYEGKVLLYGGGETQKMTQLPLRTPNEYCEVAPGALTTWRSLTYIGGPLNTDSTHIHQGIYSYGRLNANYPRSLGFDFPLSLGDQTSPLVKVGSIFPAGQSLYIGWQNGNTFGIDAVSVGNDCYSSATLELLITDLGRISNLKTPLVFRVDCEPLTAGQSLTAKYKADREDMWKTIGSENTVGANQLVISMSQLVKEIQLALDLTTTSGVTPTILTITLEAESGSEIGIS